MKRSNIQRAILFLLLVSFTGGALIGCADEGKKKRARITLADKPATGGEGDDSSGLPVDDDGGGDPLPDAEEIQERVAAFDEIKDALNMQIGDGALIDQNSIEDGVYSLRTVTTSLEYLDSSNEVQAIQINSVNFDSEGRASLTEISGKNEGVLVDHALGERSIEVATKFTVKKTDGKFLAERSNFEYVLVKSLSGATDSGLQTVLAASNADRSPVEVSLQTLLAAGASNDGRFLMNDRQGKEVELTMRKSADGELRVTVNVVELQEGQTLMKRKIVLGYTFEQALAEESTGDDIQITQPETTTNTAAPASNEDPDILE